MSREKFSGSTGHSGLDRPIRRRAARRFAEKAGLQPGDTITKWNERPIRNVRDLTAALAESEPNQTIHLTVRRNHETLVLLATR